MSEPQEGSAAEQAIAKLDLELRRLQTRFNLYREKFFAMHHYTIANAVEKVCDVGIAGSEIFPLEIRRVKSPTAKVIAFGSMGDNFGMPAREFLGSFSKKEVDILFAKDFFQCWYQRGLIGISDDIPSTAEYLREKIQVGNIPTSAVGASSGGFAAILFGVLLGVQRIVAFSPQSLVDKRVFGKFQHADSSISDIEFDSKYCDLLNVFKETQYNGRIDIFYSREGGIDRSEAERLSGMPGVNLHMLNWTGHNTAAFLKSRGRLNEIVSSLCHESAVNPEDLSF